jgi:rSAM/selenodomain-associated transferase 1
VAPVTDPRCPRALVIVAKQPQQGRVKTRLVSVLGEEGALQLYDAFIDDLASRFANGPYDFFFAYTPPDAAFYGRGAATFPQIGETLNERLLAIFKKMSPRWPQGVLVMSSDSPQVPPKWIARGFELMQSNDVVFGPCDDGGYWCVGMREPYDVFSGIPMSTPVVLEQTLALARAHQLRVALLPQTFDVDTPNDVARLVEWLDSTGGADLPAVSRVLASLRVRLPARSAQR